MPKENIKRRRKQRINQLLAQPFSPSAYNQTKPAEVSTFDDKPDKLNDPEYVWKHSPSPWSDHESQISLESFYEGKKKRMWPARLLMCCFIFFGVLMMFRMHEPWALKGQLWVRETLTEHADFTVVSAWYRDTFSGSPSFIPAFGSFLNEAAHKVQLHSRKIYHTPVQGDIITTFETNQEGIQIMPRAKKPVQAVSEGRVLFSGQNARTGLTVIIQHPGQVWSVYGGLGSTTLHRNDWVHGGDPVGTIAETADGLQPVYFAVKIEGVNRNPVDVIAFD